MTSGTVAVRDGRLELDDDGSVVGGGPALDLADAPAAEVLESSTGPGVLGAASSFARTHRAGILVACALAVAVASGAVVSMRSGGAAPIDAAIEPVERSTQTDALAPLVADYRLTAATTVTAVGLVGPGLRASTALLSDGVLRVTAEPDCADPSSLDERAPATYAVRLESATSSALVPLPVEAFDWSSELRRACWLERTAQGLTVVDVGTRPEPDRRRLLVDLGLANGTGRPLQALWVDAADAQDAELADVPVGATARLRVHLPVTTCRAGRLGAQAAVPARLSVSVGPAGAAPITVVAIYISPEQRAQVAAAAGLLCGPVPKVAVRVLDAVPAPTGTPVVEDDSAAVDLRVSVAGGPGTAALGESGVGFTAEARREFATSFVGLPGTTTVRWDARCASAAAPVLPLTVQRDGVTWSLRFVLGDDVLRTARAAACAQRDRA